jgi:flagellum-specific peptidoglycan hydrolase FlgJ
MSDLSDLFVSYKVVNTPTVTVPKFDDTIAPKAMISQGDMK